MYCLVTELLHFAPTALAEAALLAADTVQGKGPGIAPMHYERTSLRVAQLSDKAGCKGGSGLGLRSACGFITT